MPRAKNLIVGGGPAGLVLAHALARRDTVDITVVDRELDPFESPRTTDRSYTIDIAGQGLKAVRCLDAEARFEERLIRFRGVEVHRPIKRVSPWEEPGWTGARSDILQTLLLDLQEKHPGAVRFRWHTSVEEVDVETGEVVIGGEAERFVLIVGCDGAGSVTRNTMGRVEGFTTERSELPNYCMMVELCRATDALDREYLHLMNGHPFIVAGAVNGRDKCRPADEPHRQGVRGQARGSHRRGVLPAPAGQVGHRTADPGGDHGAAQPGGPFKHGSGDWGA